MISFLEDAIVWLAAAALGFSLVHCNGEQTCERPAQATQVTAKTNR